MNPQIIERFLRLGEDMRKQGMEVFRCGDLTKSEMGIMFIVQTHEARGQTVGTATISEKMGIGKSAVSQVVNGLECRGLIRRRINKTDRRLFDICLTEEGRQLIAGERRRVEELVKNILQRMGADKAEQLINLMEEYRQAVGDLHEQMQ